MCNTFYGNCILSNRRQVGVPVAPHLQISLMRVSTDKVKRRVYICMYMYMYISKQFGGTATIKLHGIFGNYRLGHAVGPFMHAKMLR